MKSLLLAILFILPFLNWANQIEFPDIVLKNVDFDFKVYAEQELNSIEINGKRIELVAKENFYSGTTNLSQTPTIEGFEVLKTPMIIPGWLALLPPLVAIILALIFKEVISSLFIGIFIGAATIGFYTDNWIGIFSAFLTVLDNYIIRALNDEGHLAVILFSITIGSIVAVISKNGGMKGVVNRLVKFAKDRTSGMLTTYFLGLAIFFDDYANTLVVGNTMRPVTDKLKVSREKLAYIVDSTAAPIAAIAFITTWIGAELTYISDGVKKIEAQGAVINESAYGIFMHSLAYSFYPIFTLFFVYFLIKRGKDFGPMLTAERNAKNTQSGISEKRSKELEEFEPVNSKKVKSFNAVIPIAIVIVGTIIGLLYTGFQTSKAQLFDVNPSLISNTWENLSALPEKPVSFLQKIGLLIGNADSYSALLWSSLTGLFASIVLTVSQRIMNLGQTMETVIFGIKTMVPAIAILVLAWSLAAVTEDLQTAEYIKTFFGRDFNSVWILPALTFVISAFIAFSTGSSWSTMALMYPLIIPLSFGLANASPEYNEMAILYNSIASVLAGAVLGDHCSPISDTTILSSLATSCDHIQHVRTQMPYALTVGAVALFIGIIPSALGISSLILIPIGITVLYIVIRFFGKEV